MSGRYTLRVEAEFAAAHQLRYYEGDCARLHGHNWRVCAEIAADTLNNAGMAMDFRDIRRQLRDITRNLDHRFLNEIAPFDRVNPTAENIAQYCYRELQARIDVPGIAVAAVTVWENERSSVRYSEQEA